MQIETNYELCSYLYNFMNHTVAKDELAQYQHKYFALYIFLLYKIFNVKIDYCKDLISIYCNNHVQYADASVMPADVYSEVILDITNLNESFELSLRESYPDEETMLIQSLDAVSQAMLNFTNSSGNTAKNARILGNISDYIKEVSGVFSNMPPHHKPATDLSGQGSFK